MSPLANLQDKELLQSSAERKGEQLLACKVAQPYTSHINKKMENTVPAVDSREPVPLLLASVEKLVSR